MNRNIKNIRFRAAIGIVALGLSVASCSTTRHIAEGQQLYTGQKKLRIEHRDSGEAYDAAMNEIEGALAKAPNGAWLGSSRFRFFPFGLWVYNAYVNASSGWGKRIFKTFASEPVYVSTVNPKLRAKAAANLLRDYGYLNGTVDYEVITNPGNEKKASIRFRIDMKNPYVLDTILFAGFTPETEQLFMREEQKTALRKGDRFNVAKLEEERQRLGTLLRNRGYYYFRPDYIGYRADTTRASGRVDLQIVPKAELPAQAKRQYYIGNRDVYLYEATGEAPNDSMRYDDVTIHFRNKLKVRPELLTQCFRLNRGQPYAQTQSVRTQERFAEPDIFRYTEMLFTPRDTVAANDTLDVRVISTFDWPYDSELAVNLAVKSNDYAGPGAAYSVTRRNMFRSGATFTMGVNGSYEWQTKSAGGNGAKINSYELGLNASLTFPRIVFPRFFGKDYDFPAATKFSLNVDQLNRAHYFKMLEFGGDAVYTFQPTPVSRHAAIPFRLTFSTLQSATAGFKQILEERPALDKAMQSRFIPEMNYTYTYDDLSVRRRKNRCRLQASFTSSGNITSGVYALFGKGFNEEKNLLGASLSQFLKLTSEIRYTWNINRNQSVATRLLAAGIYAYGGNKVSPYSEQFFIGGANSIRAFTVRSIGPGAYKSGDERYGYLDQTGDLKLEANIEYRFHLVKDLHGAIFLDSGNIWMLRDDAYRPEGLFSPKDFPNNIAVGTGVGLRYDLSYLVVRVDCGVGLHLPYETGKKGFYNIPAFEDSIGLHLAIGYPF
jgi:outer membrane protein assembly factor BamA